jgi:hypothetical protein
VPGPALPSAPREPLKRRLPARRNPQCGLRARRGAVRGRVRRRRRRGRECGRWKVEPHLARPPAQILTAAVWRHGRKAARDPALHRRPDRVHELLQDKDVFRPAAFHRARRGGLVPFPNHRPLPLRRKRGGRGGGTSCTRHASGGMPVTSLIARAVLSDGLRSPRRILESEGCPTPMRPQNAAPDVSCAMSHSESCTLPGSMADNTFLFAVRRFLNATVVGMVT